MKRMASQGVLALSVLVFLLAALPAFAQAPAGPPAPSPELAKLAFFAGDWTCKGKAEASPFGPAHATLGRVRVGKEVGGFWYVGLYTEKKTAENPRPIVFEFIQGYDGTAKAFTMDCFDNFGSHCHQTSAGWQDGKLVFSGQSTGSGPATPVRDTFAKTGDASLEHTGEMQVDGKWAALDHETCTRAKK
ncbi:MAG: hypothetical protein ACJ76N_02855 [Thermoanaerobaculia bacterium]